MTWWKLCGASLVLALCSTLTYAQYTLCPPKVPEQTPRSQALTLYVWLPGQNGDAAIRGVPFDVDVSVTDAWENLWDLNGGFAGHYESRKMPWTAIIDVSYLKLENDIDTPQLGRITFSPSSTIAEAAMSYAVDSSAPCAEHPFLTEILGGLRYTSMNLEASDTTGLESSGNQDWFDPFIGARYSRVFSKHWGYSVRGDIGGFGVGSDFTWNAVVVLEDTMSSQWAFDSGWRWLSYDYQNGEGTSFFKYDVLLNGPFSGITYRF